MPDPKAVSKAERDARLDELETATKAWATRERERLDEQVTLGRAILKGRTGSERLASSSASSTSLLTANEINFFLTGVEDPLKRPT